MAAFSRFANVFSGARKPGPSATPGSAERTTVASSTRLDVDVDSRNAALSAPLLKSVTVAVLREVADLPLKGIAMSLADFPMPASCHSKFAVMRFADNPAACLILVAEEHFGSSDMLDVKRLAVSGKNQFTIVNFAKANKELISIIRSKENTVVANMGADDNASVFEKAARKMVSDAVAMKASDIHIETRGLHADIRFRVNGERVFVQQWSFEMAFGVVSVMYRVHGDASSKGATWYPDKIQSTVIDMDTDDGKSVQVRFESSWIHPSGNFQAVLRILVLEASEARSLENLGLEPNQVEEIKAVARQANGMMIVVGPTNSGKSTACQAVIREQLNNLGQSIKIVTAEHPVEYVIPGACQIGLKESSQFAEVGRAFLRMDADVVFVGEIRDADTAAACKDMVLTGRFVLTTLHTYSAAYAYLRLIEMGVPIQVLCTPGIVKGIVFQRLMPGLCKHCSLPFTSEEGASRLSDALVTRVLGAVDDVEGIRVRGDGCKHCISGISGRELCVEILIPDAGFLKFIAVNDVDGAANYWEKQGRCAIEGLGVTYKAHALAKMMRGLVDPNDLERTIGTIGTRSGGF